MVSHRADKCSPQWQEQGANDSFKTVEDANNITTQRKYLRHARPQTFLLLSMVMFALHDSGHVPDALTLRK